MEEIILTWFKLEFIANSLLSRNRKLILNQISGHIELKTMTALMGASGSGKSTLLKCLSGINREGLTPDSRIVLAAGHQLRMCFIFQDQNSYLHKLLTVRQSLIYSSKLKNSDQNIGVNHENNVSDLMIEFLLDEICDNKVKDCSGGELKRLAIAQELTTINKPNILFIDEPTTGLDSNASDIVIKCLNRLTRKYKMSVLASIHQPNSDLLQMFDKLYVLSKGGQCLYFGKPDHLRSHLIECKFICNQNENPIEVLLKLSSIGSTDEQTFKMIDKNTEQNHINTCNEQKLRGNLSLMTTHSKSFTIKDIYYLLMRRFQINFIIQWKTLLIEAVFHLLFAFILTQSVDEKHAQFDGCFQISSQNTSYIDPDTCMDRENEKKVTEQNIYLLYLTSFIFMITTISITTKNLISEIESFSVELKNHWFSNMSYFFSKCIVDSIPILMNVILQSIVICYYSQNIIEEHFRFFYYTSIMTICILCSQSFGTIVGLIFIGNQQLAVMTSMASYTVLTFFNNYIIPTKELIWIFQFFSDLTFPKHVFNSILIIFYGLGRCQSPKDSRVLHGYGLQDNDLKYSLICSIIILVVFKYTELILMIIVSNWQKVQLCLLKLIKTCHCYNSEQTTGEVDTSFNNGSSDCTISTESVGLYRASGVILEHSIMVAWTDLTFSVKKKKKEKLILQNLNGFVEFQTINAIMGPSGAGKTTLLKCLNGQNNWGLNINSTIYLSNAKKIRSCFIKQNISEHLVNGLTVRQTLIYASKLKNSTINEKIDHKSIANELMDELLISDICDTNTSDCSGGEIKRIIIASELIAVNKPNMLCIDEPTSGLDSNSAQVIINCLKRLTRTHVMSVVATIHQPNNELLQQFDSLYVLAKAGIHIYSGPPQDIEKHLIDSGLSLDPIQFPIENILRIGSNVLDKDIIKLSKINSNIKNCVFDRKEEVFKSANGLIKRTKRFSPIDFWNLFVRNIFCSFVYEWKSLGLQIILYLLLAIGLSSLYKREISLIDGCVNQEQFWSGTICKDTEASLRKESQLKQNIQFNLAFITGTSFIQIIITTMTFSSKVNVFLNEHRNNWYSTGAYFWSKSVVDALPILFSLVIFSYIVNYYNSWEMYFVYVYCLSLTVICAQSFGHLSGIIFSKNTTIAIFVSVTFYLISSNLSNIFIPLEDFHYVFKWISNLSFLKHSINCILLKIYGFDRCPKETFSLILFKYHISDDIYNESLMNLIFILVILKFLTMFILIIKANSFYSNELAKTNPKRKLSLTLSHSLLKREKLDYIKPGFCDNLNL